MLDLSTLEFLLRDAEHYIAAAEWRITCQIEHLDRIAREGKSTLSAEGVLAALKGGRDAWEMRRLEILDHLRVIGTSSSAA